MRSRHIAIIFFGVMALQIPFWGKPLHIDDPLFVWVAQQIATAPLDFFGFDVHWMHEREPAFLANNNPPGYSYVLALAGMLSGWSSVAMHGASSAVAATGAVGIYLLATRLCSRPGLATVIAVTSPAFFVSTTTLMCDVSMVTAYVWAAWFWLRGMEGERDDHRFLLASGVLMALATLTKFYGMSVVPLLAYYALARRGRLGTWCAYVLIPLVAVGLYEWWTWRLYGQGHLSAASSYSSGATQLFTVSAARNRLLMTFTFVGGGLLPVLLLVPGVLSRRWLLVLGGLSVLFCIGLLAADRIAYFDHVKAYSSPWIYVVQVWIAGMTGLVVLVVSVAEVWENRSADSLLLFLWIAGTFVFAAFFNHLINIRTILPLVPAVAIVFVRRFENVSRGAAMPRLWPMAACVVGVFLSLSLAVADHVDASARRDGAKELNALSTGSLRYFVGAWGLQYYLEKAGWTRIESDVGSLDAMEVGDEIALRGSGSWENLEVDEKGTVEIAAPWGLQLTDADRGAGFYSHQWGPLPYVFAFSEPWEMVLYEVTSIETDSED